MGKPAYSERLTPKASLPQFEQFFYAHIEELQKKGIDIFARDVHSFGIDGAGFFVALNKHVDPSFVHKNRLPDNYQNYPVRYFGMQNRSQGELPPLPRPVDPRTYYAPTVENPRCR